MDGLSQVTAVGGDLIIYENSSFNDCCGIQALLSKGAIKGQITIYDNASPCDSKETILSTSCSSDSPDEGTTVAESDYKENLSKLTRWEAASCDNTQNYKFAADGTLTQNGAAYGTYTVAGKTLTLSPTGGTAATYTIAKMTANVMHILDASGTESIYGRKQHFSANKLSGTNWKEEGGAHKDMRMKFLDGSNVELAAIGIRGSKMAATYTVSSDNKKLTITFSDAAKAEAQGFPPSLELNLNTFNFMMMKLKGGTGVETCFNRTR